MKSPTFSDPLDCPVLFIIFNRPEPTRKVFEAIRKAKPKRLYVAADGPRANVLDDLVYCEAAREIVKEVDWNCEVKTLFQEKNLNCGIGPSTAISWFFKQEEEGIILEDDCLPTQSFFWFCQELLKVYRTDSRVMHIGGNNFFNGWQRDSDYSYYFSSSGYIWGWATWRRAWEKFDFNIQHYTAVKKKGFFDHFFLNPLEKMYCIRKLDRCAVAKGSITCWDYQWDFARFSHHGLAIVPCRNLVKNIGFGKLATHTTNGSSVRGDMTTFEIDFPLRHPPFVLRDISSDKLYFKFLMKDVVSAKIKNVFSSMR
jgi:hypothetical protein